MLILDDRRDVIKKKYLGLESLSTLYLHKTLCVLLLCSSNIGWEDKNLAC